MRTGRLSGPLLLLGLIAIIVGYFSLDRWLIYYAIQHPLGPTSMLLAFERIGNLLHALAVIIYFSYFISWLAKRPQSPGMTRALFIGNAITLTWFIIQDLKVVFSRYWPATWTNNNLSLLQDGAYGFRWFEGGASYASFPSGHTGGAMAFALAFALVYPRYRHVGALAPLLVIYGLIGCGHHFFGDIVAGAMVAYVVTTVLWSRFPKDI